MSKILRVKTRLFSIFKSLTLEFVALLLACVQIIPFMPNQHAAAIADMTPPVFVSGIMTSNTVFDTVNVTNVYVNHATLDLHVSDNISDNIAPLIYYTSPSGHQTVTGNAEGTSSSDYWSVFINFPQYSETGTWKAAITLEDLSMNRITYTDAQLAALGSNLDITLTGVGDTADPSITSMTRTNPGSIDTTIGGIPANIDIAVSDNMSGFGIPTLSYTSASGTVMPQAVCDLSSGSTQQSAIYNCSSYFSIHSETGVWTPDVIITDGAGNIKHYTHANLMALGIDMRVTLTGIGDTTPPVLNDATITFANPPSDNIPFGGAILTLTGHVTDNLTGFGPGSYISYTSASGKIVKGWFNFYNGDNTFVLNVLLPVYSEAGTWTPVVHLEDNAFNSINYNESDLVAIGSQLAVTVAKNVTETAAPGATITSDYENDGATIASPVEASVTTPTGGPVSIVLVGSENITNTTNGYTFFGRQVSINAPVESANAPLTLTFSLDSSVIPNGESASSLQITRNGTVVPACNDATTASPDPCVFSRVNLAGGDIEVKIHSTTASAWASGFPTHIYTLKGFDNPVKEYPTANNSQAGQVLPVKFEVGGAATGDLNILASGQPISQQVNCTTKTTIGSAETALSSDNQGLRATGKKYSFEWRTNKSWKNSCRVFSLKFKDNSIQKALFMF